MATYKRHALLDAVIARMRYRNDAHLARALGFDPPVVSKVRHGKRPVVAALILAIHEVTLMPVSEIRELAAA